jgi:hypothetical protein
MSNGIAGIVRGGARANHGENARGERGALACARFGGSGTDERGVIELTNLTQERCKPAGTEWKAATEQPRASYKTGEKQRGKRPERRQKCAQSSNPG